MSTRAREEERTHELTDGYTKTLLFLSINVVFSICFSGERNNMQMIVGPTHGQILRFIYFSLNYLWWKQTNCGIYPILMQVGRK